MNTFISKLSRGVKTFWETLFKPHSPPPDKTSSPHDDISAEELKDKAINNGLTGQSNDDVLETIDAFKNNRVSAINNQFEKGIDVTTQSLTAVDESMKESHAERVSRLRAKYAPTLSKKLRQSEELFEGVATQLKRATVSLQDLKKAQAEWVKKKGYMPQTKTVFDKTFTRFIGVVIIFAAEFQITMSALQAYGSAENYELVLFTFTFSVLIAIACDFAGLFLSENKYRIARVWAFVGLVVCLIVIGIRMNAPEEAIPATMDVYATVDMPFSELPVEPAPEPTDSASPFNGMDFGLNIVTLVLFMLGLTLAYLVHRHRPFWNRERKIKEQEKEKDALEVTQQGKDQAFKDTEDDFEAMIEDKAHDEQEKLKIRRENLSKELECLKSNWRHELNQLDAFIQVVIADVTASYEAGKRMNN